MGRFDKLRGGTVVNLVGELARAGFRFEFQKYPNMRNKWKIVITCPAGAKANFATVIGSNEEMVKVADALRMGGKTFLFNLSQAVGRFGETAVLRALRGGQLNHSFRTADGTFNMRNMTLGSTIQLQNKSGHGLDVITKITAPRPPAPRWVAIEVKSRMGNEVPFPRLSAAQQESGYIQGAANRALTGIQRARDAVARDRTIGRSWEDLIGNRREIQEFQQAAAAGDVTSILTKVELDLQGNPVGELITEAW
ncbi:MAG: hypothetical protein JXQ91_13250 [Vannielia sp.]|uniref:hypothetical protein n=1 Tax=Vannielia sp. TaxID=2813045 RepID=UPI003B8BEDEB